MNISRVLKYLISGVVVGAILFFAGFGIMNMLNKSDVEVTRTTPVEPAQPEITKPAVEITAPAIEVNSTNQAAQSASSAQETATQVQSAQNTQTGDGTSNSPIKIKPLGSDDSADTGSDAAEVSPSQAFGTLTLSTVNSANGQATSADFLIQNSNGVAIAQVKSTESSTLSLPAGDYKITVSQGNARLVRFLGVSEGQNGSEVFELDVPVLEDEKPVVTQAAPAPTVTTPAQTTPASAEESTSEQVAEQQATDAQTTDEQAADSEELASEDPAADGVDQPAQEATTEVTVNTEGGSSAALGGLRVSALTKVGNRPTNASFYIQKLNGENIENVKGVSTQQFNLPAGKYRITARKGTARVVTEVTVVANRGMHEIFHIPEVPTTSAATSTSSTASSSQPARPVVVTPPRPAAAPAQTAAVATPSTATASGQTDASKTGRLELFSQAASNNKSIKSNFYVQTVAGKLVANKTYVDSIGYKLPAGKYKVTVRATGYEDKSVQLIVREGQVRREVFKMNTKSAAAAPAPTQTAPATPVPTQAAPVTQAPAAQAAPAAQNQNSNRRGGLQVNIVSAETGQGLIANISVHRPDGTEVRRSNQTAQARFNLPPREFVIRINYGGLVTNQKVQIRRGKLAIKTITFKQRN